MNSLTHILIFLSSVSINNSERWYAATIVDTDQTYKSLEPEFKSTKNELNSSPGMDENQSAVKTLPNYGFPTEDTNKWRFKRKSNPIASKPGYQTNTLRHNKGRNGITRSKIRKPCPESCVRKNSRSNKTRPRFLGVFQVVEFENVACMSSSGLEGTCLHEYECQSAGGSAMGSCADGYGTCCVTLMPCDSESVALKGWFTNPDYPLPTTDRISCAIALNKAAEDIVQIRLDFTSFELLPPTAGICQEDQFVVSGHNINNVIPILCGINTGQHMYIGVDESDGPIYLSIQTANPEKRLFSVKVTQLTSSDELTAPPGCLQYFTEPKGYVESFNYRDRSEISITRTSSYLNNLNYAICIERVAGGCSVTYKNAGYLQIVNYDSEGLPVIPPGQAGVEIFNCPSDWLLISATRLCGDRLNDGSVLQDFGLNAPITDSSAGPIVVWFRSDEGYVGRGFRLQYEQNSCLTH